MKAFSLFLMSGFFGIFGFYHNPILPVKEGLADPHIHSYNGVAYMSVGHDSSINNKWYKMDYWTMYSSTDLVKWKLEYTLHPGETFIRRSYSQCWATDFIKKNNHFYWYFSQHNHAIGVMTAKSPDGPWTDPLEKPLIKEGSVPSDPYDPCVVEYNGSCYIVFGVWDYYIARLNDDMISLAENPRKIIIHNPRGPYNPDGKNTEEPTDDKSNIHFYNGKFYLSWGCFYGMSDNIYGPYDYKDCILNDSSFAEGYKEPTGPKGFRQDRHGTFFELNNQWYFSYNDMTQTGNKFFRSAFISYVHYKANGEIAPYRVDGTGVGQYDENQGRIEAENYFNASKMCVKENKDGGFAAAGINNGDFLTFPNINGLNQKSKIEFNATVFKDVAIEVHQDTPKGKMLATCILKSSSGKNTADKYVYDFPEQKDNTSLCFVFKGNKKDLLLFDSFLFR